MGGRKSGEDTVASIMSGMELDEDQKEEEEERSVTCRDIKLIMPTVLILLFTLFVMVTVIPYAFSSVIKQLQAVWAQEESKLANAEAAQASATSGVLLNVLEGSPKDALVRVLHT